MKRTILSIILVGFCLNISATAQEIHPDRQPLVPEILSQGDKQKLSREVLDSLFGKLHKEKSEKRAKLLASAIWKIWSRSGSPTADLLLGQAERAMAAGQQRIAISILSTVIEQYPQFTEAWNKRATAYFIANDYDKSLSDIKQVLDREPRHFGALSGMGMIYRHLGKNKKALTAFRRALAIHPQLKDARRAVKRLVGSIEQDI